MAFSAPSRVQRCWLCWTETVTARSCAIASRIGSDSVVVKAILVVSSISDRSALPR